MFNRNALLLVAGGAFFALSTASAQTRPTSTRRIPVSKEAPGEVATPRVDTVTVYRTDTLRMQGRVDTLRMTNTVTVHDTVVNTINAARPLVGGMYFGIGGGVALPYGSLRDVQQSGELGQIELGWQRVNSPLGVRLDGVWNKYGNTIGYGCSTFGCERPQMMNLNADLRLNLPIFNGLLGSSVRMTPYLLGGGSWVRYQNLRMKIDADGANGSNVGGVGDAHAVIAIDDGGTTTANSDWHSDWGFNFGGGVGFHAGKKEVYIESRGIRFTHDNGGITGATGTNGATFHAAYNVPIVFGVRFF
jgi:hypothetical protein